MKKDFNKGLLLTSLGSFWWGFIGVIYFEYLSFIGHIELVVHRCLWTAVMLILTTSFFSKWKIFFKIIKNIKILIILFFSGLLIWVAQLLLADFLSIGTIRPDFLVILVLYWSIKYGRTIGTISGFLIGLIIDFSGTASYFGLSSLIYSVTGYFGGYLMGTYSRLNPIYFSLFDSFSICASASLIDFS